MRLTSQLFISHGRVARKMGLGPESRINMLRNILTGLVRHERIETTVARADEVRFYAEKVTSNIVKWLRLDWCFIFLSLSILIEICYC